MREKLFNVNIDNLTEFQALTMCKEALNRSVLKSIYFINAHCFNIAQKNKSYYNVVNNSDLVFNDGIGIKLGGYLNKINFLSNLNGTDLIPKIIEFGVREGKSFYFVGGSETVVNKVKSNLLEKYSTIKINGVHNGYFTDAEEEKILDEINSKEIDILIVGMGVPKQELWISQVRHNLKTVKLCVAGGAILDFISGRVKRAPRLMRRIKLEWLFRLYLEPGRLWRRYIFGNILFIFYLIRFKITGLHHE